MKKSLFNNSNPLLLKGGGSTTWLINKQTHMLIAGGTGSGKTVLGMLLLNSLYLRSNSESLHLIVVDPKNDWRFAKDSKNLYQGDDLMKGVEIVYQEFLRRKQAPDESFPFLILWIDELNSLVESLDKKEREEFVKKLRLLLYQSRFVKIRILNLAQAVNASVLGGSDARSQFDVAIVFNINNPLNRGLLQANENEKGMLVNLPKGQGFLASDGEPLRIVKVKRVTDFKKLQSNLIDLLNRKV